MVSGKHMVAARVNVAISVYYWHFLNEELIGFISISILIVFICFTFTLNTFIVFGLFVKIKSKTVFKDVPVLQHLKDAYTVFLYMN